MNTCFPQYQIVPWGLPGTIPKPKGVPPQKINKKSFKWLDIFVFSRKWSRFGTRPRVKGLRRSPHSQLRPDPSNMHCREPLGVAVSTETTETTPREDKKEKMTSRGVGRRQNSVGWVLASFACEVLGLGSIPGTTAPLSPQKWTPSTDSGVVPKCYWAWSKNKKGQSLSNS